MTLTELLEYKGKNEEKIVDYLLKHTHENNWHKIEETQQPFAECMNFIRDLARKAAVNNMAIIEEEQVYQWALDFYNGTKPAEPKKPEGNQEKPKKPKAEKKKDDNYEEISLF